MEEKEKDKEAPVATEATDVKDKSEAADMKKGTSLYPRRNASLNTWGLKLNDTLAFFTEEVKGEKDAGKEVKTAAKEEAPRGNGRPLIERPRFMFNIADGGFTGQYGSGLDFCAGQNRSIKQRGHTLNDSDI